MEPALWKLRLFTYCVFLFQSEPTKAPQTAPSTTSATSASKGFSLDVFGPSEVTGYLGGSLNVRCHYGRKYGFFDKYWCHGWTRSCSVLVTSTNHQRNVSNGRISISDDPASHSFIATMKELRAEDAGWYRCGISTHDPDPMFTLKVTVLPESIKAPQTAPSAASATSASKDQKMSQRPSFTAWNAVQVAQIGLLLFCMTVVCIVFRGQTD